jgi:hypothetical protein
LDPERRTLGRAPVLVAQGRLVEVVRPREGTDPVFSCVHMHVRVRVRRVRVAHAQSGFVLVQLRQHYYWEAADIWSYGVLFYQTLVRANNQPDVRRSPPRM